MSDEAARRAEDVKWVKRLRVLGDGKLHEVEESDPPLTREELAAAVVQAVTEERERCAQVADGWAHSKSCTRHDDNPCCHVRTGAGITEAIRRGLKDDSAERVARQQAEDAAFDEALRREPTP